MVFLDLFPSWYMYVLISIFPLLSVTCFGNNLKRLEMKPENFAYLTIRHKDELLSTKKNIFY